MKYIFSCGAEALRWIAVGILREFRNEEMRLLTTEETKWEKTYKSELQFDVITAI
jgi:hypothetical protein